MMCIRKITPVDDLKLAVYNKTAEELLEAPAEGGATPDLDPFPRALTRHTR